MMSTYENVSTITNRSLPVVGLAVGVAVGVAVGLTVGFAIGIAVDRS